MSDQPKKRGLGSPSIDPKTKAAIHSAGGKASHGGGRKRVIPVVTDQTDAS